MLCRACGSESPDGQRFCGNCGTAIALACAGCGVALPADQRFCGNCGLATGASTEVASQTSVPRAMAAEPVAERRRCSVLFVDLVNFTGYAERRDPEEVRELLTRYFDAAQSIIENYGGTVEKFIGDAVMAVWGAPIANEDDAERAVRAGLEVLEAVRLLGASAGHEGLQARGGIVTGETAVTIGKVAEGMVLGDTVNSASRVQSAAEPNSLLVDRATWSAASGSIAFEEIGALTLKGKEDTVEVWRALRVVGQRRGLGRSEGLEPPFVGRDEELRLLRELLHATSRESRARLVSVTGVPGIGKSRLAWEFLKYVDGLVDDVYWHQGHSSSFGESVAFGALGEMLRMRAGINEVDGADEARAKLHASVVDFVEDEVERRWIEPRLAHLIGLADAPKGERDELFSAWRTFFERISSRGVTVMVFEDVQWADSGLVDFIESILEWSRDFPILVVTLSRPELLDLRPDWGSGQRLFVSVHLEPLRDDAMRSLIEGFVTGLPETVLQSVLDRAEGVPLYAVETVRMLVGRGALVPEGDGFRVEGDITTVEIAGTLHALVASRLDALSPELRSIVQDASVIGASFLPETLANVSAAARDQLDVALRDLVRREFFRLDTDPRSPERGQYGFVQGVIGDVARSMLSRRDLSAKHLEIARYYASLEDDDLIETVASHFASAYRAAPSGDDSALISESAREWLRRAGERALSLGSPVQALALFEEALAITTEVSARSQLLVAACDAANTAGDYEKALSLILEAIADLETLGDETAKAFAIVKHCVVLAGLRRHHDAIGIASAAFDRLDDDSDLTLRAHLALVVAGSRSALVGAPDTLLWAERSLDFAEQLDDPILFARALRNRGNALYGLGRQREAVMAMQGSESVAAVAGSLRDQINAMVALSLFAAIDDPRDSLEASLVALELSRKAGLYASETVNLMNSTEFAIWLGDWSDALQMIDDFVSREKQDFVEIIESSTRVLAALRGVGVEDDATVDVDGDVSEAVAFETTELYLDSMIHYARGDFTRAHEAATRSLELDPSGLNASVAIACKVRAALWLRDRKGLVDGLSAAQRLRGRWMSAVGLEASAALAALDGDPGAAKERFELALDAFTKLQCTLDIAMCELGEVYLLGEAAPWAHVEEALRLFTDIGARPFATRLRELRPDVASAVAS